jgi:hypothetical protein
MKADALDKIRSLFFLKATRSERSFSGLTSIQAMLSFDDGARKVDRSNLCAGGKSFEMLRTLAIVEDGVLTCATADG